MSEREMSEHEKYKKMSDRKMGLSREATWHAKALEKAKELGATGAMLPKEVIANEDGSETVRYDSPIHGGDFDKTIKRKKDTAKHHFQKAIQHGAKAEATIPPSEIDLYEHENPRPEDGPESDLDIKRIHRETDERIKDDIELERIKRLGDTDSIENSEEFTD